MNAKSWIRRPEPSAEYYTEERCHILELSNGPEDEAVSIARARVAPGVTTRKHRVADTAERYIITSGKGTVHIEGLPAQAVGVGDVVFIAPGVLQSISNTGDEDLIFLCICSPRFRWDNYAARD